MKASIKFTVCTSIASALYAPLINAKENKLEEVVVAATLTEESIYTSLSSISKIDEADIKLIVPDDLAGILEREPGIDVVRTGSLGSVTSVQMRGAQSNQTLFLINGLRFNSATVGLSQFNLIDPSSIQSVEIVRGSRSALYGADAIAGVIEIKTLDVKSEPSNSISLLAGSNNSYRTSLASNNGFDNFYYSAQLSYFQTDGIDSLVDDNDNNADLDAYENMNINLALAYQFDNKAQIEFTYVAADSENDFDNQFASTSDPFSERIIELIGLNFELPITDSIKTKLIASQSADESENFDRTVGATPTSFFETQKTSLYWQNNFKFSEESQIIVGVDYYEDEVEASTDYSNDENKNTAPFIQLDSKHGDIDLLFGYRMDDNENFGKHEKASFALGFAIDQHHRLFASVNEGFRAPTFNDLYWPESAFSAGNPNLLPEESKNKELGLKSVNDSLYWEIVVYENEVENLIDWAPGDDGKWRPSNVAAAELKGAELSIGAEYESVYWEFNADSVSAKDTETGSRLPDRPKVSLSYMLGRNHNNWDYGLLLKRQSERKSASAVAEDYVLLDLYLHYAISNQWLFSLKINNVADENYQLNPAYNQDGTNASARVEFTF